MKRWLIWLSFLSIMFGQAAWATSIPVEDFFRQAEFSELKLSPNGQFLAALRPYKERKNLVVIDLKSKASTLVTSLSDYDVSGVRWINNHRLLFSVVDLKAGKAEQYGGGMFAVNRDGSAFKELAPTGMKNISTNSFVYRGAQFFSIVPEEDSDDILVTANERDAAQPDVYRMDSKTGKKKLLVERTPPKVVGWAVDAQKRVRIAQTHDKTVGALYYRENEQAEWQKLLEGDEEKMAFSPVSIDMDDTTLYVMSRGHGDRNALYTYDLKTKKMGAEPLLAHSEVDLDASNLIFSRQNGRLLGATIDAAKMQTVWFDARLQSIQAGIDQALPDRVNQLTNAALDTSEQILVNSFSDRDPGRYYLFYSKTGKLEELLPTRPWINPEQMATVKPYRYAARDGLSIPAYLTVPHGVEAKNLPLVLLVHGGPWVRGEHWNWNPESQFLASRGYAVLQPEYRGSTGYGRKHYRLSWKQWGLSMQDDLTDGVNDLIKQGIVDPKRVCIAGASYGGYATMMGLVKDPEFYRCGINWVGVTDIKLKYEVNWSDYADSDYAKYRMADQIGDPDKDADQLLKTSPLRNADKITKPVLMAYGGGDRRVPMIHGTKMRDALEALHKPVEWVVYPEEGHGWMKLSNNVDFWTRVEKFLATNLTPLPQ